MRGRHSGPVAARSTEDWDARRLSNSIAILAQDRLRLTREMVKLLYSALYTQPAAGGEPVVLTAASELSSFGYFQRGR